MKESEKKLILLLFGAAFIIVNLFLFTSFNEAKQKKKSQISRNAKELTRKKKEILESGERVDEVDWLINHEPKEGTHADVRADLVTFIEQSAKKAGVKEKKRPVPLSENLEREGRYNTAKVKMVVNAEDEQLIRWITELQNPEKSRAVTFLRILPQRDDNTRIDCELEVTQWFVPSSGDESEEITKN